MRTIYRRVTLCNTFIGSHPVCYIGTYLLDVSISSCSQSEAVERGMEWYTPLAYQKLLSTYYNLPTYNGQLISFQKSAACSFQWKYSKEFFKSVLQFSIQICMQHFVDTSKKRYTTDHFIERVYPENTSLTLLEEVSLYRWLPVCWLDSAFLH